MQELMPPKILTGGTLCCWHRLMLVTTKKSQQLDGHGLQLLRRVSERQKPLSFAVGHQSVRHTIKCIARIDMNIKILSTLKSCISVSPSNDYSLESSLNCSVALMYVHLYSTRWINQPCTLPSSLSHWYNPGIKFGVMYAQDKCHQSTRVCKHSTHCPHYLESPICFSRQHICLRDVS